MANEELTHERRIRVLSFISGLLGLWLIVSPWIVRAPGQRVANSGIVVGVLILVFALVRFGRKHTSLLSWGTLLLGAWTVMSAWVLGEDTGDIHTWNYVIVGMLAAGLSAYSLTSSATQPNWRQRETGRR